MATATKTKAPAKSKEVAVVDAEVVATVDVPKPLTEAKAKSLDKRIRAASDKLTIGMDALLDLLNEAASGQIHVALGYASWPAYLKDAVKVVPADRTERKQLTEYMSGRGMSNRAISAIVGVDEKTVRRDTEGKNDGGKTEGLDGKSYKRKSQAEKDAEAEAAQVIDAEVVDDEGPERKATDVIADFDENMDYLFPAVQAFTDMLADDADLWGKAQKRIARKHLNTLQDHIANLQAVVDALMDE